MSIKLYLIKWPLFIGIILFSFAFIRKVWIGIIVMNYVGKYSAGISIENLKSLPNVKETLTSLPQNRPTLIIFLNKYIIEMTLNWLCNVNKMKDVHSNTLFIVFDSFAANKLIKIWPNLKVLKINIIPLQIPFNYGDGPYQLFSILRANIASLISSYKKPFFMIQQDTFWRLNLLKLGIEANNVSTDIIFDRSSPIEENNLIAGGYFYVRPTKQSVEYFNKLASKLINIYSPDNVLMSSLCSDIKFINCKLIPFCTISNWLWINNLIYKEEDCKPALIQFDGDAILSNKLMKMHALGFYFLMEDGETCNFDAVEKAKKFVKKIAEGKQTEFSLTNEHYPSFSQQQFALYLWILDQFYKFTPTTWLLNNVIYPNAHYLMITI